MKKLSILLACFCIPVILFAQHREFTHQDTLRGSITPERAWWDLTYYDLMVKVNIEDQTFSGSNTICYKVIESNDRLQIDLQKPMRIEKIRQNGKELEFSRDGYAWYAHLQDEQKPGDVNCLEVIYSGKPRVSKRPPWQGGVSWQKDMNGNPFIATANQGDGSSLWWPCKDHPYDEVDSMLIRINVPDPWIDVSNGRLIKREKLNDGTTTYHWFVRNPINAYGVNINIGDYVNFSDVFQGEKGALDCNYWVIKPNLEKAKEHFKQAHKMLEAFEHWFGPYPFYEDGYKLVEVPYPGMEHQSSVTYGNGYRNGYGGRDVSSSGYGDLFDFIIIHESGHEWFANSITNWDVADMWIHESFIAYSENLYVDYFWGKEASADYCRGTRMNISNRSPVVGVYNVNRSGSGDMYSKGANMLHTLRQMIDDDEKWRQILRGLNKEFYHQTVKGEQIENYIIEHTGLDLEGFFDQYLRDTRLPTFEYSLVRGNMRYRWANCVNNFKMKVKVYINGEMQWLEPGLGWKQLRQEVPVETVKVDKDFYVAEFKIVEFKE